MSDSYSEPRFKIEPDAEEFVDAVARHFHPLELDAWFHIMCPECGHKWDATNDPTLFLGDNGSYYEPPAEPEVLCPNCDDMVDPYEGNELNFRFYHMKPLAAWQAKQEVEP